VWDITAVSNNRYRLKNRATGYHLRTVAAGTGEAVDLDEDTESAPIHWFLTVVQE
jgi:ABC-type tungstate transport system permease subunit